MPYLKICQILYKLYSFFHKKVLKTLEYQQIMLKIHDTFESSFQASKTGDPALGLLHAYLTSEDYFIADAALLGLYRQSIIRLNLQADLVSLVNGICNRLHRDAQDFPPVEKIEADVKAWCDQHKSKIEPVTKAVRDQLPQVLFQTAGAI